MPYPAKLTAEKILEVALELLEEGGSDMLGMRPLAQRLHVRPSSLYRYYPERNALLEAIKAHITYELHSAIRGAARDRSPDAALTAAGHTYLAYAREHPHLYALLLRPRTPHVAGPGPGKALWDEVLALVGAVTKKPDDTAATVAFWAYLHGFALLEQSGQFGVSGPQGGFERGLGALVEGFRGG